MQGLRYPLGRLRLAVDVSHVIRRIYLVTGLVTACMYTNISRKKLVIPFVLFVLFSILSKKYRLKMLYEIRDLYISIYAND